MPKWLKSVGYFVLIVLIITALWESYKLLAAPGGLYLRGTAEVKVGDERLPGPLCSTLRLCKLEMPIRADDRSMPHVSEMISTIFQPPRRGSDVLLWQILAKAALFTLREAMAGFLFGALLGFGLGILFAHSGLLERGLLPFVVASQTVPLLAIAPMVVTWSPFPCTNRG